MYCDPFPRQCAGDGLRGMFRCHKNNSVKRHPCPHDQLCQQILAAHKPDQRVRSAELMDRVRVEVVQMNVCQKDHPDLLQIWAQLPVGYAAVKQVMLIQQHGVTLAAGGDDITGHPCSPASCFWWAQTRPCRAPPPLLRWSAWEAGSNPPAWNVRLSERCRCLPGQCRPSP